jgi:NitT/TauT family transport system substrate-binding protein
MPFDVQVSKQMPDAVLLATGDKFYGPRQGLLGGWVAGNQYYQKQREVLQRIAKAWLTVNEYMIGHPKEVLEILRESTYSNVSPEQLAPMLSATRMFANSEWETMYKDGSVAKLIGDTERVFIDIGAFSGYVEPTKFFDASIFLDAYKSVASPTGAKP